MENYRRRISVQPRSVRSCVCAAHIIDARKSAHRRNAPRAAHRAVANVREINFNYFPW